MKKIRIGVLMGGRSNEHEVSFNSGRTICDHLDTMRYDIVPLYQTKQGDLFKIPWSFLCRGKTTDFVHRLNTEAEHIMWDRLKEKIDCLYIAMHGYYSEDGRIQGICELFNIPYIGSKVLPSALGMDKYIHKKILTSKGIRVARSIVVSCGESDSLSQDNIVQQLNAANLTVPLIVKPSCEGSSLGVTVVKTYDELLPALQHASLALSARRQKILIEEYIQGMEFTCILLQDPESNEWNVLSITEIVAQENGFFDYEQKYMPGKSLQFTPARCSQSSGKLIEQACKHVAQALDFSTIARIDGFLQDDDTVVIIDPNSFSGAAPSSFLFKQAAARGMNHTHLINHLIKAELYRYKEIEVTMQENNHASNNADVSGEKIRVAVLFGGASHEKEISLESGRNVLHKLSPYKYEAIPVYVRSDMKLFILDQTLLLSSSTSALDHELSNATPLLWAELATCADFVFIALHGGVGENGCVQGFLETVNIPYNGSSVLTSALCMNKFKTNQFLKTEGFEVPRGVMEKVKLLQKNETIRKEVLKKCGTFPLIAKPHDDGCSVLVYKIFNEEELLSALEDFAKASKEFILLEECIEGTELTVGVIGNDAITVLPPSQVVVQGNVLSIEEKFLPGAGENQTPALLLYDIRNKIQETIGNVYRALDCKGYARIDCFYQSAQQSKTMHERVVIIEINTLPGLTPATCLFHQAAEIGLKPMDFIDRIIQLGLEHHALFKEDKSSLKVQHVVTP